MSYIIKVDPEAVTDIQNIINWYNHQQKDLGKKFHGSIEKAIENLKMCPYLQIRYDNVRCYPLRKYPFMIHYTVKSHDKTIIIRGILHTSQNTEHWYQRFATSVASADS